MLQQVFMFGAVKKVRVFFQNKPIHQKNSSYECFEKSYYFSCILRKICFNRCEKNHCQNHTLTSSQTLSINTRVRKKRHI